MKFVSLAALAALVAAAAAPAAAQVTVTINQPGVYGRVVLGSLPVPPLLLPQPVLVRHSRVAMQAQPVYMYVPPGHAKHWHKHCNRYNACTQQVYFVQERWVQDRYAQRHHDARRPSHARGHGNGHGHGHGHNKATPVYVQR